MTALEHLSRHDPLTRILEVLKRDGGLVVDDFMEPEVAKRLAANFAPDLDRIGWGNAEEPRGEVLDAFFGHRTKRLHGLIGRSPAFEKVLTDDFPLACARGLLGAYSEDVILSTGTRPGAQRR